VRAGLAVARHRLSADVIIAGMGPGSVGTGTTTGYSGLEVGAILDAAADAHGQPIATLRVSDRDPRPRHQGVSHHSATALRTATHVACVVPIPEGEAKPDVGELHDVRPMPTPDVLAELAARGIAVSSMGRAAQDDPRLFAYAAAAGAYAASVVAPPAS